MAGKTRSVLVLGCLGLVILVNQPSNVAGHGRLMDPPQRSSMWRVGFDVPANYQDNELFCGGFNVIVRVLYSCADINPFSYSQVQYNEVNHGSCGECGDEWSLPRPRPNDEGGRYGTGIIGRNYTEGQVTRFVYLYRPNFMIS